MPIYLHPLDENPKQITPNNWIEIDLLSWEAEEENSPKNLSLIRRLDLESQQPYLQELMFVGLYDGQPINEIILEIPQITNSPDHESYCLKEVKVVNYSIYPPHPNNKKAYEKLDIIAH